MQKTVKVITHDESSRTSTISDWSMDDILSEINRDHSEDWTDYDETDWRDGWREWVFPEYHELAEDVRLISLEGKPFVMVKCPGIAPQPYEVINPSDLIASDSKKYD